MVALLFEFVEAYAAPSGQVAFKQAVHHHVGVAAYGRSEMGVEVESEPVVADVLGGVDCLCHRADGEHRQVVFLAFPFHFLQHLIDGAVDFGRCAVGLDLVAESACNRGKVGELGRVGLVVHAVDECLAFAAFLGFAYGGGNCFVGQEHELLDEFVGIFRHFEIYADRVTCLVDVETHFFTVEVDRSVLKPACA